MSSRSASLSTSLSITEKLEFTKHIPTLLFTECKYSHIHSPEYLRVQESCWLKMKHSSCSQLKGCFTLHKCSYFVDYQRVFISKNVCIFTFSSLDCLYQDHTFFHTGFFSLQEPGRGSSPAISGLSLLSSASHQMAEPCSSTHRFSQKREKMVAKELKKTWVLPIPLFPSFSGTAKDRNTVHLIFS